MIIRCSFVVELRFELEFLIKSKGNSITKISLEIFASIYWKKVIKIGKYPPILVALEISIYLCDELET